MIKDRLGHACAAGLSFPDSGRIALIGPPGIAALPPVDPMRCDVVQTNYPDHQLWQSRLVQTRTTLAGPYSAAIVTLARERALSQARIAAATTAVAPSGLVVVDGAKTDGIEPIIKALRGRVTLGRSKGALPIWAPAGAGSRARYCANPVSARYIWSKPTRPRSIARSATSPTRAS
jgi:16S rRNA (guanine1207-N2)-methyltransferase